MFYKEEFNEYELMLTISQMTVEQQNEFFTAIESIATKDEINAMKVASAYFGLLENKAKRDAMKDALAQQLYREFTGKELTI